jgi:hypothetical protein
MRISTTTLESFRLFMDPEQEWMAEDDLMATIRGEFGDEVMAPALALIDRPATVFEAKGIGRYDAHDVVAKADQMVGATLKETKTTLSSFDFDKYAQSCQWRFMADIFDVPAVTYHVFLLDESEANGVISLKGIETFTLYRYAELHADCLALVREFAAYVDVKGLTGLLDARQQAAA